MCGHNQRSKLEPLLHRGSRNRMQLGPTSLVDIIKMIRHIIYVYIIIKIHFDSTKGPKKISCLRALPKNLCYATELNEGTLV